MTVCLPVDKRQMKEDEFPKRCWTRERQVLSVKSRSPQCGVCEQTDPHTHCLQCDYTLNHFIVVKYWSLFWNEIISCGPSSVEPGRLVAEPRGICPAWLWAVSYARSVSTLANPKPVSGGLFWMNSLAGPRQTRTCLRRAATHSRCRSYDHAHLAKWSGKAERVHPGTKDQTHTLFHSLWYLLVFILMETFFCLTQFKKFSS